MLDDCFVYILLFLQNSVSIVNRALRITLKRGGTMMSAVEAGDDELGTAGTGGGGSILIGGFASALTGTGASALTAGGVSILTFGRCAFGTKYCASTLFSAAARPPSHMRRRGMSISCMTGGAEPAWARSNTKAAADACLLTR